jgi:hypothetical protein
MQINKQCICFMPHLNTSKWYHYCTAVLTEVQLQQSQITVCTQTNTNLCTYRQMTLSQLWLSWDLVSSMLISTDHQTKLFTVTIQVVLFFYVIHTVHFFYYFGSIRQTYTFIFYYSIYIFHRRRSNMFQTLYEVHLQGHLFSITPALLQGTC